MLTLAEHFAKVPRAERRRNIVLIGTAGHHVGSPNSPSPRIVLVLGALLAADDHHAAHRPILCGGWRDACAHD